MICFHNNFVVGLNQYPGKYLFKFPVPSVVIILSDFFIKESPFKNNRQLRQSPIESVKH